jgi:hypothetical protein
MSKNRSRTDKLAADQNLIDGIQKHAATLPPTLTVGSQTVTQQEMVTTLQGRVATGKAVIQADSARTAAVKADRDKRSATQPQVGAFERLIIAMYLESPDILADYGLVAPKVPVMSAQQRADAAAKRTAKRKALTAAKAAIAAGTTPAPAQPVAEPVTAAASAPVAAPAAPVKSGS